MVKWKILIAVALYIILGFIAYFNFGFHHLMIEKIRGKNTVGSPAWKKLEENIKKTQTEVLKEFQDSSLNQGVNEDKQLLNYE